MIHPGSRAWWGAWICVLIITGALVFRYQRPARPLAQPLPDGSTVRILEITHGPGPHRLVPMGGWWRHWWPSFPENIRRRLRQPDAPLTNSTAAHDRSLVWVGWIAARTNRVVPFDPEWHVEAVGSDGFRSPLAMIPETGRWQGMALAIRPFEAPVLPWRDPVIRFDIVASPGGRTLATFKVPNPRVTPGESWTCETLPAVRTQAGMTFEMVAWHRLPKRRNAVTTGEDEFEPAFRIQRDGQPSEDWRLHDWMAFDPTGNRSKRLNPAEPAWRVEAGFIRSLSAPFEPTEGWVSEVLTAPRPGKFAEHPARGVSHAATVELIALGGAGSYEVNDETCVVTDPNPPSRRGFGTVLPSPGESRPLRIEVRSLTPFLLFRVPDRPDIAGVVVRWRKPGAAWRAQDRFRSGHNRISFCPLDGIEPSDSFQLQIIVQKPVTFSWTVQPPRGN